MDRIQMARQRMIELFDHFEDKYIIGLSSRPDRRQRIEKDFDRLELSLSRLGIEYFDGLVFDDAAGFPGVGVRGCFNSHLALMRRCADNDRPMLVMEDDVDFDVDAFAAMRDSRAMLAEGRWDIIYFGYLHPEPLRSAEGFEKYDGGTIGGHFYAVQPEFARAIADFMEACMLRPAGSPEGGPMYRDGVFTFFRARNPDCKTLLAAPPLAGQFSSRSDLVLQPALYDKLPIVRGLASFLRARLLDIRRARSSSP